MNDEGFQRLRLLPLNQVAAIKLKAAGAPDDLDTLPVFQLMTWGLANGIRMSQRRTGQELLRLRHVEDRRAALDFLLTDVPGGVAQLPQKLLSLPPRGAAEMLLEMLDLRLKADPNNPYPAGP